MFPVQNMMYKLLEPTPEYLMNQDINSISTQIADLNALAEFNAKVKLFFWWVSPWLVLGLSTEF